MRTLNLGLIGTGNIAPAYIRGCELFDIIKVTACADILDDRAGAFAAEHGLAAYSVDELLARDDIDIVVNLTIPAAHAAISLQIIETGKHVYSEKPLAISRAEGAEVIKAAKSAGVRVGCAPDTFLGGGLQTARKVIDDGIIGRPIAATAVFMAHGPEAWHPNPGIFYLEGGGPLFDMGPYYLTALVSLMGPVARVAGSARITFPERIATSETLMGQALPVEVNTHVAGTLEFECGAIATVITSFDIWGHHLPPIEIHGEKGSLCAPDPNRFDGDVQITPGGQREWADVPLSHTANIGRGAGVADMAYAIQSGRPHRASGALALHVLDIMCALEESAALGQHVAIQSRLDQPAALPAGLPDGELDT
ncbi:MAG: Gfo/Idh/MocA family oxidoreductase [Chloroflexi bacterium]|nr:Gfo/Idh/MocA family oxidoreductase [Chloroflexota bacterium]